MGNCSACRSISGGTFQAVNCCFARDTSPEPPLPLEAALQELEDADAKEAGAAGAKPTLLRRADSAPAIYFRKLPRHRGSSFVNANRHRSLTTYSKRSLKCIPEKDLKLPPEAQVSPPPSARSEITTEESWSKFLLRSRGVLCSDGIDDTPEAHFEIFRTSKDLSLIFASFACLFDAATAHQNDGSASARSQSRDARPPWEFDSDGCVHPWRFPYEPLRILLAGDWKAKRLWELLDARVSQPEYENMPWADTHMFGRKAVVVGAGPCGLRAAIELRLLGAQVTIVERRQTFSRINQLHIWNWCAEDIKGLGGKSLEPPPKDFGANPDLLHISISDLQTFLLKVALLLGVEVLLGIDFGEAQWVDNCWQVSLRPVRSAQGSHVGRFVQEDHSQRQASPHPPSVLDGVGVLIVANGFDSSIGDTLGLKSIEKQSESAIGIVVNFARTGGKQERKLRSFSMARQFYAQLFKKVEAETGAELENIVYTKGNASHYFVMTPTRRCLIKEGVVTSNGSSSALTRDNVDQQALACFARRVAAFPFKGSPAVLEALGDDVGSSLNVKFADGGPRLFDFSKTRRMEESITFVKPPQAETLAEQDQLLVAFVGDALIEPFWPEGLGIMRGFFAVLDACSSMLLWAQQSSRQEVMSHSDEAYVHLKTLAAASKARVLHRTEAQYRLMPRTRYRQFMSASDRSSFNLSRLTLQDTHAASADSVTSGVFRSTTGNMPSSYTKLSATAPSRFFRR